MGTQRSTLVYSGALLIIGVGLGWAGTLLSQQWGEAQQQQIRRQPRAKAKLSTALLIDKEPSLGTANAPLTIVEFSDFECPYCKRFHEQVFPKLNKQYVETGLVRFVHKDLPLPFHQQARSAAAATRCASEQDQYWELYGALYEQQNCLSCKGVQGIAGEQNLDLQTLEACMERTAIQTQINANISEAALHNIRATPTFVIGPTLSNGKHEGEVIEGALPWPRFRALIDQKLQALKRQ